MKNSTSITLDGDFVGHPFRGNGAVSASGESRSAVTSSKKAKHAEKHGDPKAQKKAHKVAHHAHMAAAEEATTKAAHKYHKTMAKFHGSRAGMTLDSVTFDDASDFSRGNIVGKIMQGGKQMGRAVIAGDGKAMVFVGDSDDQRVKYVHPESGQSRDAIWGDGGEKLVEWLLVPVVAPVAEPAPVEVYAFKDASDEAMGLLRIGAQNTATRSTYKTAVSVEQSADAHGMAIRWEAVDSLPTFDDATGGLFGDGDQGHIRGDLSYNGTKLAQVYVREDGMAAFDYDKGLPEALGSDFDQFEDEYTGWNDAWDDVIYKLRNECDENGLGAKEPVAWEILIESLKKSGFTQQDEWDFVGGEGLQYVAIHVIPTKQAEASLMYWAGGDKDNWKYAVNIGELDGLIRADQKFDDDFSEDEMQPIVTELLTDAKTLQAWVESEREKVRQERARKRQSKNPEPTTPEPTVTPDPATAGTNAKDREFFMSLIDGTYPDLDDPELVNNLEAAYQRNSEDAEMMSLFTQAINAYTTASLAETEGM